jgi:cytochrome P450
MDYVVYRSQNLLAMPTAVPTPRNIRFRRRLRWFDGWLASLIAARRQADGSHSDLLEMLLQTHTAAGRPLSDSEIRDECLTLLIAGYETVATGMGWMLYLLSQRPELRHALRQEVQLASGGQQPTAEQVAHLPLLNQVIHESFRLYPPSWLVTRRALADDVVLGYRLPAGALVAISPYVLHRHPAFWPHPERFDLGRWTAEGESHHTKSAYIPFGGGPHLCIGKPFALLEAQLTLAAIVSQFDFELATPDPITPQALVTIRPSRPLGLKIRPCL